MTSEVPHRPGHEPGEVSPGAGGPAPYGDRPTQQDHGYPGAADLGWAPPPPAGPPTQPASAWGQPGDQPAAGRAAAQVVPPGDQGGWGGSPQPAWTPPEQAGTAWGTPEQEAPTWASAQPAPYGEPAPPGWAAAPANGSAEAAAPAWSTPAEQNSPGWGAAGPGEQPAWPQPGEPNAHGAAPTPPHEPWATTTGHEVDDPARSGGWAAAAGQQGDHSGGWAAGAQQQDDPNRSGGWAAGRAVGQPEAPQAPAWGAPDEQRPAWGDAAAPQGDQDQPAQAVRGSATVPTPGDQPESGAWASARASVSVPAPDSPSAGGGQPESPAQWAPERPAIPAAEPWAPGEAWGRSTEGEPDAPAANGWEPARAEEPPSYQPAPPPGISPANAVPLPAQEQRVPGAALAASPPADYAPPAQFAPAAEPADRGYEPEQAAWGTPEPAHEEPQSPAGPVVPGPRISPESGSAGAVSASASVPAASRVAPPADQPLHAAGVPAPQPRVYGRPARPESEEALGQEAPNGFPEPGPRFDEPGPQPRFDEPDRAAAPNAFAEAPPAPPSPAGPPPFPPGMPSFADPPGNNRPVNGVHLQGDERAADQFSAPGGQPDPFSAPSSQPNPFGTPGQQDPYGAPSSQPDQFGAPGGQPDAFGTPSGQPDPYGMPGGQPNPPFGAPGQQDPYGTPSGQPDPYGMPGGQPNPPFGAPGQQDPYGTPSGQPDPYGMPGGQPNPPFGAPGQQDPYGTPGGQPDAFGGPGAGRASVAAPGPGAMGEPGQGNFPPAFPPAPQQAPPAWSQGPANDPEQGRFDSFKPEAEPPAGTPAEAPIPKVRNGRVLALVLLAAVLILAVPLGLLMLLGKIGGSSDNDKPAPFNPAVGTCVKQSGTDGTGVAKADCAEPGAFKVASRVESKDKCADTTQPTVVLNDVEANRVLCLKPVEK